MVFNLHLYIGPMYAGKTTQLITSVDTNTLVLDYTESGLYESELISHRKETIKCVKIHRLCELFITDNNYVIQLLKKSNKIVINEAQFFPDLIDFIKIIENYSIQVEVYGLDGDFERKSFGQILDIIPLCDSVTKLKGKCYYCDMESIFSKRITTDKEQYLVDETAYRPVCRLCYNK